MSSPTKEYWQAKADLCMDLAIKQSAEDNPEAGMNLMRMTYALSMVEAFNGDETICTFCNDNAKSCKACDDSYEGE